MHARIPPPPGPDPPPEQTPPPPGPDPPRTRPLWSRHPPSRPPGADPPTPRGSRLQHTVYERPVRILLECILVANVIVSDLYQRLDNRFLGINGVHPAPGIMLRLHVPSISPFGGI